jgi:hypothetical protein
MSCHSCGTSICDASVMYMVQRDTIVWVRRNSYRSDMSAEAMLEIKG